MEHKQTQLHSHEAFSYSTITSSLFANRENSLRDLFAKINSFSINLSNFVSYSCLFTYFVASWKDRGRRLFFFLTSTYEILIPKNSPPVVRRALSRKMGAFRKTVYFPAYFRRLDKTIDSWLSLQTLLLCGQL